MEEVFLLFIEWLFVYPGAFVRWLLFYRKTKTIKEVIGDDWFKNSSIGILIVVFTIGLLVTFMKYISANHS